MAVAVFVCGCAAINFGSNDSVVYKLPLSAPQFLVLGKDHSFSIQNSTGDEYFSGKWTVSKDTLIMTSDEYTSPYEDLDTQTKEALRFFHGECFERYLHEDVDSAICVMSNAAAIFMSECSDSTRISIRKAAMWLLSEHANDGYRDIHLIRGRYLYDGVNKTRACYVRIKPKKRQTDVNQVIE